MIKDGGFIFQNPRVGVHTWSSEKDALGAVSFDSPSQKIYSFDSEGNLIEIKKIKPIDQ